MRLDYYIMYLLIFNNTILTMKDYIVLSTEDSSEKENTENNSEKEPKNYEVEERKDHNAPEKIMDDLDEVDKARNGDPNALEYLKREYPNFFENNTNNEEELEQLEDYLESEFPGELEKSEKEADELEERCRRMNNNSESGGPNSSTPSGEGPTSNTGGNEGSSLNKMIIGLGSILSGLSDFIDNFYL